MRLSLQVTPAPGGQASVDMYLDAEGLDLLRVILDRREFPDHDHEHLFSQEWGGEQCGDLTVETTAVGNLQVHMLTIHLRPTGEALFTPQIAAEWERQERERARTEKATQRRAAWRRLLNLLAGRR